MAQVIPQPPLKHEALSVSVLLSLSNRLQRVLLVRL